MFFKLLFLFVVMPIVEIALLLHVGELIGGWTTFLIVIVTAIAGAHLVRAQGLAALSEIQHKTQQGVLPAESITEGLMILVAGVLLVTPGFITDAIGLCLTIPLTRKPLAKLIIREFGQQVVARSKVYGTHQSHQQQYPQDKPSGTVIEGEWQRKDDNR
ncbi:FxsA cytoplasmic membrane protein [Catenovulum agarivorans DS-2]|uniref:FxsA cytoplasmic membrane protein n=1 Tax=Catenovulum agarivorans DS-2 TaxID=1328313 RepID=W7QQI8_9ALTE|nr:FxsA family protein [Catenovulum agarivorans]EWH11257.1 FxsA cytoplasmic membrane protein [Catenovulum agarivorans DS-2]